MLDAPRLPCDIVALATQHALEELHPTLDMRPGPARCDADRRPRRPRPTNYVIRREDGTTATEHFFGAAHGDLFEHLVEVMPLPARPRRRQRRGPPDLFAAAA
ncbi:MAG: hypothetical protein JWM10_3140 [Myxococcaceae bacterium]|nr:hypothetical protein [Myxococcaceae bacterium]